MSDARQQCWFGRTILVGVLYAAVGVVFALPTNQARVWRLATWLVSGCVYAAHIWYERFRLRNSHGLTAMRVGVAAGVGGFGLAVAAVVHSLFVPPNYERSRFVLALLVWPVVTGAPAFLVALAATALTALLTKRRLAE